MVFRKVKAYLVVCFLIPSPIIRAQEMLVTAQGREYKNDRYRISEDGTAINVRTCPTCVTPVPFDSVAELVSFSEEKIYHLKHVLFPSLKVAFLELVSSGRITVYKRISKLSEKGSGGRPPRRPKAEAAFTQVEQYFLEKDGYLLQVLPTYESAPLQGLQFKEFVNDDAQSLREIADANFELTSASLFRVVEDYNARHFVQLSVTETNGRVSLVRDSQVTAPLTVDVNGETLLLSDVLTMQIPVSIDSKVCLTNAEYAKCQVIRGTRHFPLFLEVRVNKASDQLVLRKVHSKRFTHIAQRVSNSGGR
jgi:hypothetical protein